MRLDHCLLTSAFGYLQQPQEIRRPMRVRINDYYTRQLTAEIAQSLTEVERLLASTLN